MSYTQHQSEAEPIVARVAVVTLSDTRTEATDGSGQAIRRLVADAGHVVVRYHLIRDEPADLEALLRELLSHPDVDVVLTNGGTGIGGRDRTMGVVDRLIETPLPGFGELFRMLSWEQVGSGAMLSRASGGVAEGGKLLFAMPGSTKAVELAMSRLVLPELKHLLRELRK
ncbi:MAG: molybdenum cofactor biosynthesis protein [Phycisphaerales bacterium]|nr:molybdenum cofactor biosynthesis protein [Phycisphaerales bacterium]